VPTLAKFVIRGPEAVRGTRTLDRLDIP
jgi:hypothetical protein